MSDNNRWFRTIRGLQRLFTVTSLLEDGLMNDVSGQHNDVCDVFLIHLLSKLRRISSIYCQDAFEIVSFIRKVTRIFSSLYKLSDSRTTKISREHVDIAI